MATQNAALPALDLSTGVDRPFIRIDTIDYDLRVVDDFTALELKQLDRLMPRVLPLANKLEQGEATEAQCEELSNLLSHLLTFAIAAPPEVVAKLGDINKVRVFRVFIDLLSPRLQQARADLARASRPSGKKSSRNSNGSTAAATSRHGRRRSR